VIRLKPAAGDDGIAALLKRFGQGKFQLSNLVAGDFGSSEFITLDPNLCPRAVQWKSLQLCDWSG
jgi:hypothetical protein